MAGTLTRPDPFAELAEMRSRLERMFDEWPGGHRRAWTPAVDVVREDGQLVIRADLPGIKPEEVKVEVENDFLTVSGEHRESSATDEKDYVRRERRHGAFHRSMPLPHGVDATGIKATTHDGIVEVRVPLPATERKEAVTITPTAG